MGLGTKIKEVLKGDDRSGIPDTSTAPGGYPSEHTPRTHAQGNVTGNTHASSEPHAENVTGKDTSDYTYGSSTSGHGTLGASEGHRDHGHTSSHGISDDSRSHGHKLTKNNKSDPYWGDSDRSGTDQLGSGANTTKHTAGRSNLDPHDVTDRYHGTSGTTGSNTSGLPEGTHGGHSSRLANAADPRYDSDRDHRDAPSSTLGGSSNYGGTYGTSNTSKLPEGTHGGHSSRGANIADPRIDSDRDHRAAPTSTLGGSDNYSNIGGTNAATGYGNNTYGGSSGIGQSTTDRDVLGNGRVPGQDYDTTRTGHSTTAGGAVSSLPHRPRDSDPTHRDHKINEYDAPSSSSGRGHDFAGAGTGAAAGLGAAKFADSHREHGLIQSHSPTSGNDPGLIAPHSSRTGAAASTDPGMLDPYDKTTSATSRTSGVQGSLGQYGQDSGYSRGDNSSIGSSELGSARERYGPGHEGARVMHKCYSCGADNDISRHFQKDAVYRMG